VTRRALTLAAVALVVAACGGDEGEPAESSAPAKTPAEVDFPAPNGRSLEQLIQGLGAQGPVLAAASSEVEPGRSRFGFGLFDRTRKQIQEAPAAIYIAPKAGGPAAGPFVARWYSMKTEPQFRSKSVATDPDAGLSVYASDIEVPRAGDYYALALLELDGRLVPTTAAELKAVRDSKVPEVGEKPPKISTPTGDDVKDISEIETREPPDTMHDVDFADVVGKKPIVLVFATPSLCQARVCGPVVDIAEEVKAKRQGEDIAWIHMEIHEDNDLRKGFREQLLRWNLRTEPWAFTLDRSGRIAARLEGAWGAAELDSAVDAAVR